MLAQRVISLRRFEILCSGPLGATVENSAFMKGTGQSTVLWTPALFQSTDSCPQHSRHCKPQQSPSLVLPASATLPHSAEAPAQCPLCLRQPGSGALAQVGIPSGSDEIRGGMQGTTLVHNGESSSIWPLIITSKTRWWSGCRRHLDMR